MIHRLLISDNVVSLKLSNRTFTDITYVQIFERLNLAKDSTFMKF